MRKKMKQFTPLSEVLFKAFKPGSGDEKESLYDLTDRWEGLVGRPVAKRSTPLKILGKTLIIGVEGPAWAQELSFIKESLLEKIRKELPHLTIDQIRFQTESPSSF